MHSIGSIVPGFSQTAEATTKHISVASAVWFDSFESMAMTHVGILLFGVIGMVIIFKNCRSTLSGLFPAFIACCGLGQAIQLGTIFHIIGIVSIMIAPFALVLCAYHICKMYTWCTVADSKYRSMWGL